MKATNKLYQVFLVKDEQTTASRYFQNENRAKTYCQQYNQILEDAGPMAIYQEIDLSPQQGTYRTIGSSLN